MNRGKKWVLIIVCIAIGFGAGWYCAMQRFIPAVADRTTEQLVREIPGWWGPVPLLADDIAQAIYPYAYFPEDEYAEITGDDPGVWVASVLVHERVHLERQEEMGPLKFGWKYVTNKDFRLEEELVAISRQMEFLQVEGGTYDIERKAEQLSGKTYGELLTEEEVIEVLTDLWETGTYTLD